MPPIADVYRTVAQSTLTTMTMPHSLFLTVLSPGVLIIQIVTVNRWVQTVQAVQAVQAFCVCQFELQAVSEGSSQRDQELPLEDPAEKPENVCHRGSALALHFLLECHCSGCESVSG